MNALASFIDAATPTWLQVSAGLPASLLLAVAYLSLAGWLKREKGWRTGYTRKVFHFLVFSTVGLFHSAFGLPLVCIFGCAVSLVVFYAVIRGDGNAWYEAMAREKDAPRRTHFILAPYAATLVGGVAANVLFGPAALAGYLVAGFGDAIGEPVGTRWGRNRYRIPSLGSVVSHRTIEGSAAVLVASFIALVVSFVLSGKPTLVPWSLVAGIACCCALVEAVSPHGWDNATMQLVPSALIHFVT